MRARPGLRAGAARVAGAVLAAFLAVLGSGCEGPSSEAGKPTVRGTVTDAEGRPVPGAGVALLRMPAATGDRFLLEPPAPADSAVADAAGRYRFPEVEAGEYALVAHDPGRSRFGRVPLLSIQPGRLENGDMVARAPGRIRGVARRRGAERPGDAGIVARAAGIDRRASTDSLGRFVLAELPPGTYDLSFAAADGRHLPAFRVGVAVAEGGDVALPDTAWLGRSPFADSLGGDARRGPVEVTVP